MAGAAETTAATADALAPPTGDAPAPGEDNHGLPLGSTGAALAASASLLPLVVVIPLALFALLLTLLVPELLEPLDELELRELWLRLLRPSPCCTRDVRSVTGAETWPSELVS